jgi:hypothetical protein
MKYAISFDRVSVGTNSMGDDQANRSWPKKFEALRLLGCDRLNGNRSPSRTQHLLRSVPGLAYSDRLLDRVGACLSSDPHTPTCEATNLMSLGLREVFGRD